MIGTKVDKVGQSGQRAKTTMSTDNPHPDCKRQGRHPRPRHVDPGYASVSLLPPAFSVEAPGSGTASRPPVL
jgi:hypothetical protein